MTDAHRPAGPPDPALPLPPADGLLRLIADAVPVLISYVDRDFRYRLANAAYGRWFGLAPDRVVGRHVRDVLGEAAWGSVRPYMERALAGEEVVYERELPYRVGGSRVVRATYTPDRTGGGFVVLVDDVTALWRAEAAVRRSEERYRAFVAQSTEGIWRFELDEPVPAGLPVDDQVDRFYRHAYLAECNDALARMYGYAAAGELVGARLADFLPPDDPRNREYLAAFVRSGYRLDEAESFERDRAGRPRVFRNSLAGVVEAGLLTRAWGTQRDVTDRWQAEEAVGRLAAIVESSDEAIVSKTLGGVIRTWNGGAARLFGYTPEEAVGRSITLVIPPDRLDEERVILDRLRRGERVEQYETVRVAKDGRRIDISLTVSPVRDATGRVVGAAKVARDITDRKRTEEVLRVEARRKDEFLAVLAHELRNPLAPIRNAVEILAQAGGGDPRVGWVRGVLDRQVGQLARLVDDLLDLSRVGRGKVRLAVERVAVADVLDRAVETSRPVVDAGGHRLTVGRPVEPLWVDADPTRLAQVLSNLLNNAAKYTPPGGAIELAAARAGDAVEFRVADTGIGIPADKLGEVFEPFSQVDTALDRAQGGLGIGLAIVRRLVELHGGTVMAHSDGPGRGSRFTVRLPLMGNPEPGTRSDGADTPGPPLPVPHSEFRAPKRVLVVDDNVDAAESLALLLQVLGHVARTVHDGPAALAAAREYRPEVVFLDIGMPGMTGHEVAVRLRAMPEARGAVLVAVTGWGQEEDRRRTREAGFDRHLVKPVDPEALREVLAGVGR